MSSGDPLRRHVDPLAPCGFESRLTVSSVLAVNVSFAHTGLLRKRNAAPLAYAVARPDPGMPWKHAFEATSGGAGGH